MTARNLRLDTKGIRPMKALSALVVLMFAPATWAEVVQLAPAVAEETQSVQVVISTDGAPAEGQAVIRLQTGAGEEDVQVMRFIAAEASDADKGPVRILHRINAAEADPNRGWLGVALGESMEVEGVRIENVVKDSPAQEAGLLTGDIVTAVNGEPVEGISGLSKMIRELGPDSQVTFAVDRDGQLLNLTATLDSPPKEWNWTMAPDMQVRDHTKVGKVIMVTPDGEVTLDGHDDLFNFHNLLVDRVGSVTANVTVENGEKNITLVHEKDDQRLEVSQAGDGPIIVDRDGVVTEYADNAALEAGDAEAFELYSRHANHQGRMLFMPQGGVFSMKLGDGDGFEWATKELHETLKNHMKELDGLKEISARIKLVQEMSGAGGGFGYVQAGAKRSFKVNPDGQIEVTIRKGENEVIQVFSDEADLGARDPELFEKYAATLDAEIDE